MPSVIGRTFQTKTPRPMPSILGTRIDRYMVAMYVRVLVICFVSLCGLIIVVHLFSNLDEFIRFAKQSQRPLWSVLTEYYGPYTLTVFERLCGILALLAAMFVVAWMHRTNELTSLMAAGISKRRIVRPLLFCAIAVIVAAVTVRELAIPRYQDRLDRNPQDLTGDYPRQIKPTYDATIQGLVQGRHLLPARQEIVSPVIKLYGGPLAEVCGGKIVGSSARFLPADEHRPAGYLILGVTFPPDVDALQSIVGLDGRPLLLTHRDAEWVPPGGCFVASEVEFEMLRGGSAWKQFASTLELINHLRSQNERGRTQLEVLIHQRMVRPLVDLSMVLLGLPIVLSRLDRHVFWIAGACLLVTAGFAGLVIGLSAVSSQSNLIPPMVATWLPILIALPWGYARLHAAYES
ncbi:MAG: LptF/LptG family permease [Planctomycetota bacterium]|nr:MAG: LptF/LptG family permease [Planctomycetota bacterium]